MWYYQQAAEGVRCVLVQVEQVRAIVHLSGAPPLGQLGQCRGLERGSLQHERRRAVMLDVMRAKVSAIGSKQVGRVLAII